MAKKDGRISKWLQRWSGWNAVTNYFNMSVNVEVALDPDGQFIFANHPHGVMSFNHFATMVDSCKFLSKHHRGDRRDLVASVLFFIPILREILLSLGCVDASQKTAMRQLNSGRSILIFVGGEKEQLMTSRGKDCIYLKNRKGFIKLAIQTGVSLVPMYAFGEDECYNTPTEGSMLMRIVHWIQKTFAIVIPLVSGRWGTIIPFRTSICVEIGKPIKVAKKPRDQISETDINHYHELFMAEMIRLFDRTKSRHGRSHNKLVIE